MITDKQAIKEYTVNGHKPSEQDIKQVIEIVRMYPGLSLEELIKTICVVLRWNSYVGTQKEVDVERMLQSLAGNGLIKLTNQHQKKYGKWRIEKGCNAKKMHDIQITEKTAPGEEIHGVINDFYPVSLELAGDMEKEFLWNEYVERYHELKYGSPFGDRLKYFITIRCGNIPQYAGCMLFSASSWALEGRDRWIGWTKSDRMQRLNLVVNNTRFLIFPWIRIRNLASWALGEACRRIREDWKRQYKYEPVLLETFVDAAKYTGICYTAANWIYVGESKGEGRHGREKKYVTSPKKIYMYPLVGDFRDYLMGKNSGGGAI
jgi:hypothetical protein